MSIIAGEAVEMAKFLGCTPCIPAVGIGRSFYEASTLMLEAVAEGQLDDHEAAAEITAAVNASAIGPLGLGGGTTALGTLLRIGQQKASGIRVACLRMLCHAEPRRAKLLISS
jgi:fumarate hydratase subunit alpha